MIRAQAIGQLMSDWDKNKVTQISYDNYNQEIILYWDEYQHSWTIEPLAIKGYFINRILKDVNFNELVNYGK